MDFPKEGLVTSKEAQAFLRMSRTSFFEFLNRQDQVKRIRIGPKTVRYRADVIRAYVDALTDAE